MVSLQRRIPFVLPKSQDVDPFSVAFKRTLEPRKDARWLPEADQTRADRLLAATGVKLPKPVRWYSPQPLPAEDYSTVFSAPGGLHGLSGFQSLLGASTEAFGTKSPEQWPQGMTTVDMLLNRASGKPFAVRVAIEGKSRRTAWEDATQFIAGYTSAGECAGCHGDRPGVNAAHRSSGGINSLAKVR